MIGITSSRPRRLQRLLLGAVITALFAGLVTVPAAANQPGARGLSMECPGPDSLCGIAPDLSDLPGLGDLGDLPGLGGCGLLDALCGADLPFAPGLPGAPGLPPALGLEDGAIPGLGDIPNPVGALGDVVAKAAADAWTAAMLAIWNSGLFIMRIVLTYSELFLTPDLSADGPGKDVYAFTLWFALALVVILTMVQLGAAAFKRDGKSLARAFIGAGQFVIVCACWFGYCATIVTACGAITRALMKSLLKVNTWPEWEPLAGMGTEAVADATVATVLAFLGIFLWLAAIGHLLVYLARAASLLVLTATGPLAAAGLVSDATRAWFWKSLRWFHAAALTPVLMVMVLGIGVQFSSGVAAHLSEDTQKAIGTALPSVMITLITVVCPLALFKLLAFIDPGTPSGASFRQGMAAQGGLHGLLSGGTSGGGSSAASTADSSGRSSGEQSAETSTGDRFNKSTQGVLSNLGPVGQAVSTGLGAVSSAGAKAASLLADETNQAGVGQGTYGPDFSGLRDNGTQNGAAKSSGTHPGSQDDSDNTGTPHGLPLTPTPDQLPVPPPPTPAPPAADPNSSDPPDPAGGQPHGQTGSQGRSAPKPSAGGSGSGASAGAGGVPPVAG
jgi:type IV secretion system protein TrbL